MSIDINNKKNTATLKLAMQTAKKHIAGWPLKKRITGFYNETEKPTTYTYQNITVPILKTDDAKSILNKFGGVIINNEKVRFTFNSNINSKINHSFKLDKGKKIVLDSIIMNDGGLSNYGKVKDVPNKKFFK